MWICAAVNTRRSLNCAIVDLPWSPSDQFRAVHRIRTEPHIHTLSDGIWWPIVTEQTVCDVDDPNCGTLMLLPPDTAQIQLLVPMPPRFVIGEHVDTETDQIDRSDTWVVKPGEHFWSIARSTRDRAAGSLHDHWLALIELNRDRLPDPCNPDLVYPGTELLLP